MIRYESNRYEESRKNKILNTNFKKAKINAKRHKSIILGQHKFLTQRIKDHNKLNKIFEEEKGENKKNIVEIDLIKRPKLPFKLLYSTVLRNFYSKYNKYYTATKIISKSCGKIRPNIYGLYQINNLLNKKKCKIKVYYDEFHLYFNHKENLFEFINIRQSLNLLKFIVTFLQGNNIYNAQVTIKNKFKYKAIYFKNFIKIIISKLNEKERFKNSIFSEIIDRIYKIKNEEIKKEIDIIYNKYFIEAYEIIKNNNIFEFTEINDLSERLENYMKYLPIMINLPIIYYKSFLPNFFLFGYKVNNIIKDFVIKILNITQKQKENFIEKLELKNDKENSKTKIIKGKINTNSKIINDSSIKNKDISFKNQINKEEILDNKPIWHFIKNKEKLENKRQLFDNEIIDIQNYISNLKLSKNKTTSFRSRKKIEKNFKDALIKKIVQNNMINKKDNNYIKESNSLNANSKMNKNNNIINKNKLLLKYNYKKSLKEENKDSKSEGRNGKNFYDGNKTTKIITQYKSKYYINNQKYIVPSIGDTKNSSSGINNNNSSNLQQIKKLYKIKKIFYTSTILTPVSSRLNKKSNIFKNSKTARNIKIKKNIHFKDSKEFILHSLRNNQKLKLNTIELKNIKSISINQNLKNFFDSIQNYFNFHKIKLENKEENVWEKGIYKEQQIKKDYEHNKLMKKILRQTSNEKRRTKHRNLFDKKFSMTQISKMDNIYN